MSVNILKLFKLSLIVDNGQNLETKGQIDRMDHVSVCLPHLQLNYHVNYYKSRVSKINDAYAHKQNLAFTFS